MVTSALSLTGFIVRAFVPCFYMTEQKNTRHISGHSFCGTKWKDTAVFLGNPRGGNVWFFLNRLKNVSNI